MTAVQPQKTQRIEYPERTLKRAARGMKCLSFKLELFVTMGDRSVPLLAIVGSVGVENNYLRSPLKERKVEADLLWLIQLGVLRREVDGQGITDSFRLTPLGRQLVGEWEQAYGKIPDPAWGDRLYNFLNRWLRFPTF
jgi:hypothetical protein